MARNWTRARERDRMRQRGIENARAETPFMRPLLSVNPWRPRPSKADLRQQADAALAEWKARQHP
jgi:hypothetical protein